MTDFETAKHNNLYKFFILIPFIFVFLLKSGGNRVTNDVSTTTVGRKQSLPNIPPDSSIATNRFPMNTTVHQDTAQTAWCVLDNENLHKFFYHFPHALQVLSRCWSYFMMERRKYGITSCGFFFDMIKKKNFNFNKISPWAKDLIKAMNCSRIIRKESSAPKPPSTDDYYYLMWTRRWFEEVEDAAPLREAVLQRRRQGYTKIDEFTNRTVSIGLIQRVPRMKQCDRLPVPKNCRHFREFTNLKKIQQALAKNFPSIKIKNTKLRKMDLVEQASWWWNTDIVIAAHGATLSNVLFMRPKTAVIEVFPTGYEPRMFQQLMVDVGVYGYSIQNATPPGVTGFKNRDVPLEPNVNEIVSLVREVLQKREMISNPQEDKRL